MLAHLGVKETGPNRGLWIDECLRFVGLEPDAPDAPPGGYPWCCAAFVWCAHRGGVELPRTGSVARLWKQVQDRRLERPEEFCAFVHLHISGTIGHIGYFMRDNRDGSFLSLSGNTNSSGSRTGNRVALVVHDYRYVYDNGGGFFHMRPEAPLEPVA